MTLFLLPDGTPYWGGTYFPRVSLWGKPSFRDVLNGAHEAFRKEGHKVAQNASVLRQVLRRISVTQAGDPISDGQLDRVSVAFLHMMDRTRGGLRGAPKFPNAPIFRLLWSEYFRTNEPLLRDAVVKLLDRMSAGGIWDHLGGGFARYSTDADWLVPHFEKMLYDNAQMLELLSLAYAETRQPVFAERADALVQWMAREMRTSAGFASAQDADSNSTEGEFYVWTADEVNRILGPDAALFRCVYDVTHVGNWDGVNILNLLHNKVRLGPAETETLRSARAKLFAVRAARTRPQTDMKVLADWNGLAIAALARAASVFDGPDWMVLAENIYADLRACLRDANGRLAHAFCDERVMTHAMLDDCACMAHAALILFQMTGKMPYLYDAIALVQQAEAGFSSASGSFYSSAADTDDVIMRLRSAACDATPSGNGMMAENYARLFHITGYAEWGERAQRVIRAFSGGGDTLATMPTLLGAASLLRHGCTVVVRGAPDDPAYVALLKAARACADPMVIVLATAEAVAADHPAHAMINETVMGAAAFVCRDQVCLPPVHTVAALRAVLLRRTVAS